MSTATPLPEPENPGAMVRAWVRSRLDKKPGTDIDQLHREAVAKFKGDNAFLDALVGHYVPELTLQEIRRVINQKRKSLRGVLDEGEETFEDAAARRLLNWYESNGHGYLSVVLMTRPQLHVAIANRQAQVDGHLAVIEALQKIADGLPNDETTVGDHFAPDVLLAIFRRLFHS